MQTAAWRRKWCLFVVASCVTAITLSVPFAGLVYFQNVYLEEPGKIYEQTEAYGRSELYISAIFILGRLIQQFYVRAILWVGYPRQSKTNQQIMRLTSVFLIFMVLVLPSVAFAIGDVFLSTLPLGVDFKDALNCVFNARGTLTFIKLLVSTALLGNAAELLRVQDLFFLLQRLFYANSWAEVAAWMKFEKTLLWFGDYFSYDILNLTITVSLGTISPIILPVGLACFIIKHIVSSFTLRTSFIPTKIDINFHRSSVTFVIGATVLSQLFTALCINLKVNNKNLQEGQVQGKEVCIVSAFLSILSTTFFILEMDSGWSWPIPVFPFEEKKFKSSPSERDNHYFPHCLQSDAIFNVQVHV